MAVNLWPNADLEANIDDWNVLNFSTISHSSGEIEEWQGDYCLKCAVGVNAYSGIESDVKYIVEESTQYTLSFYFYPTSGTISYTGQVKDQDANFLTVIATSTYTVDTWTRIDVTFATGAGDSGLYFYWQKNNEAGTDAFYVDGIMLETGSSASTWVNYIGAAVEFAATIAAVTDTRVGHGS